MSEAKHTPGPWIVEDGSSLVTGGDGNSIADVIGGSGLGFLDENDNAECLANARLIEAAPDLLAACLRWKANLDQGLGYDYDLQFSDDDVRVLEAAITKATGKTGA